MAHKFEFPVADALKEKFWKYVPYQPEDPNACWYWIGGKSTKGYGVMHLTQNRYVFAHRLSWMIAFGEIPEGLCVCHKCDHPPCVRPSHFFLGTSEENTQDMFDKGRYVPPTGEKTSGEDNWQAKLTDELVVSIRRRIRAGEKGRTIARELGLSEATISEAKNGRLWDHVNHIEPPLKPWSKA